jgi:adenosylcobinamide kinase / adenosylcobinamide-phosphate guanylyltransferase
LGTSLFILGGARSGKSRFALTSQHGHRRVALLATAEAGDADMAARIARHQAERPRHWRTVEEPVQLVARLEEIAPTVDAVVVDYLNLWVANLLLRGDPETVILRQADALGQLVAARPATLTLVSNEVGLGVHPPTVEGLRFRDALGLVNQRIAAACDRVVLLVAGLPLTLKEPARSALDDAVIDAP